MIRTLPNGTLTVDQVTGENYGAADELMGAIVAFVRQRTLTGADDTAVPLFNAMAAFVGGAIAVGGIGLALFSTAVAAVANLAPPVPGRKTDEPLRAAAYVGIMSALERRRVPAAFLLGFAESLSKLDAAGMRALVHAASHLARDSCSGSGACLTCEARKLRERAAAAAAPPSSGEIH